MNWFLKLKLANKLLLSFLVVAAIAAAIGGIGIFQLRQADERSSFLYHNKMRRLELISGVYARFELVRVKLRDAIMAEDRTGVDAAARSIATISDSIVSDVGLYEKLLSSRDDSDLFAKFKAARADYRDAMDTILALAKAGRDADAKAANRALAHTVTAYDKSIADMVEQCSREAGTVSDATHEAATDSVRNLLLVILAGFALAAALGLFLTRVVTGQIGGEPEYAASVVKKVAEGDFTLDVRIRPGDTTSLLFSMKDMTGKLLAADGAPLKTRALWQAYTWILVSTILAIPFLRPSDVPRVVTVLERMEPHRKDG